MRSAAVIVAAIAILAGHPPTACGQNQQVRIAGSLWGFDGRVVPGQFNPASFLLDNLTDEPIDGIVRFHAVAGLMHRSGGIFEQPVYLAANSRRWVQFYPYIASPGSTWSLTIRAGEKRIVFDDLQPGGSAFESLRSRPKQPPVAVILDPPGMARQAPTSVKHMDDEIFPPYATAMTGLRVLFLDHVPDWEEPRQQALMSWLRSGGQIHLLNDANGQTLRFSGDMAPLNEPFAQFAVGTGMVTRHDVQRTELTKAVVEEARGGLSEPVDETEIERVLRERQEGGLQGWQNGINDPSTGDEEFLTGMRRLTQPEHAWWLLLLMSICYIGLIFPGCWLLSQKRTIHFLATYGAIAALAVVFSLIFLIIGRRGYGESTTSHVVAVARFEDERHCSVMEWGSLFVTSGDTYEITSPERQTLFCAGGTFEAVDATVTAGNKGRMVVEIPPFSAQTWLARRRLPVADWMVTLQEIETSPTALVRLVIQAGPEFPDDPACDYLVLYRNRMYRMSLERGTDILTIQGSLQMIYDFCNVPRMSNQFNFTLFGMTPVEQEDDETPEDEKFYQHSLHRLVERSLLDDGVADPLDFVLPADRVRLYVYAPMAKSMQMTVSTTARQQGRVLFVRDLLISSVGAESAPEQR